MDFFLLFCVSFFATLYIFASFWTTNEGGALLKIAITRVEIGRKLISIGASFVIVVSHSLTYYL